MMKRIVREVKKKLKNPVTKYIYELLMRDAKLIPGRQLFDAEELKLVHQVLISQNLFAINGRMVNELEKEFAKAYNVPYAVASTSGTAAIHTALGVLGLNPGDEIITAPITDLGTVIPILYQNAIPVFADIDDTYNMDPADVESKITDRTKAIIVVHLFGNPCDMNKMVDIAKRHNIVLIEDCAQAHMTEYKGRYVGTIGDIGSFSFQQSKHMSTGDGGMAITSNEAYYEKMKLFVDKNYARTGWGARAYYGLAPNYRMNELTAAVGLAQVKKVKAVVEKRHELGEYLTRLLSNVKGIRTAPVTEGAKHSYWLYPLHLEDIDIDVFAQVMKRERISVSTGYTVKPIYLCSESLTAKKTYGNSGCPFTCKVTDKTYEYKEGLCPKAEEALKRLICIPLDESWSKEKIELTAKAIKKSIKEISGAGDSIAVSEVKREEFPQMTFQEDREKVRIGIVGCGKMGRWHFDSYKRNPQVELAAFADVDFARAKEFAQKAGGAAYRTHKEMLECAKLDGVSVCTVPSTHRDIALDLLDAGINVLCEKPLAISITQAQEMIDKAKEKHLLLLTAFKFRFFEEILQAKDLIEKGSLGSILNFRLMFGGYLDMSGMWFSKKEISGGGVIIDSGSHAFDLIRHLFGDIKSIQTKASHYQNIEVEDTAHLEVILDSGVIGNVDLSWSISVPSQAYLEIYAENGTALLDPQGIMYKFKTWNEWKRIPNKLSMNDKFSCQIDHFVEALKGKPTLILGNEDGLRAQLVIEAAYQSLLENREMPVNTK